MTPDVDFVAVAFLAQDLGGDVVWGTAECSLSLAVKVNLGPGVLRLFTAVIYERT